MISESCMYYRNSIGQTSAKREMSMEDRETELLYDSTIFEKDLEGCGIQLSREQVRQFQDYYDLLVETNKVMNLTGITEYHEVMKKHFVDSVLLNRVVDIKNIHRVIDVGTGAGFPGIPLKIVYPHLKVVLLDSLNKRIGFLGQVVDKLGLRDVNLVHGRAEDYARDVKYRQQFDLCVSRAVANLALLSEYCIPYVRKSGCFVAYKSGDIKEEVTAARKAVGILGGKIEQEEMFQLPDTDISRSFVVIRKIKDTPIGYPRKAGIPKKDPII